MNSSRLFLLIPALALLPLAYSCGPKLPQGVLPEKEMADLLLETHLADAMLYVDSVKAEEKKNKGLYFYPSILEKHGIAKAEMDSSVAYYMRHPAAYARIYASVVKELEKRRDEVKKPEETEE